jgi:cytoskeletal protein CcmA (bactofilin family)
LIQNPSDENEEIMKNEFIQQPHTSETFTDNNVSLNSGKGDFSFKGNLIITGLFSGKIVVTGTLTLGADSRLTGEVVVNDLIVFGDMVGSARVSNKVVFHSSSIFSGTVTACDAEIYSGSCISGKRNFGHCYEKEAPKTHTNNKFNIDEPTTIPNEMTHHLFRL